MSVKKIPGWSPETIRKPAPGSGSGSLLSDLLAGPALGPQWAFYAPAGGEAARIRFAVGALHLAGKGTDPSDASPLTVPAGDRAYEIEVVVSAAEAGTQGGLLLFFNRALFLGLGWDGTTMTTYSGGHRSHFREPAAPGDELHLRIVNDHHIVTMHYSADGVGWTRHGLRFDTSGYHANTVGDLLSLRPALFAAGRGTVTFRDFRYRAVRCAALQIQDEAVWPLRASMASNGRSGSCATAWAANRSTTRRSSRRARRAASCGPVRRLSGPQA